MIDLLLYIILFLTHYLIEIQFYSTNTSDQFIFNNLRTLNGIPHNSKLAIYPTVQYYCWVYYFASKWSV